MKIRKNILQTHKSKFIYFTETKKRNWKQKEKFIKI